MIDWVAILVGALVYILGVISGVLGMLLIKSIQLSGVEEDEY